MTRYEVRVYTDVGGLFCVYKTYDKNIAEFFKDDISTYYTNIDIIEAVNET